VIMEMTAKPAKRPLKPQSRLQRPLRPTPVYDRSARAPSLVTRTWRETNAMG
jgi:hypothetical protein